jgi:hypothetical protein
MDNKNKNDIAGKPEAGARDPKGKQALLEVRPRKGRERVPSAQAAYFFAPFSSWPSWCRVSTVNWPRSLFENSNWMGHGLEKNFVSDSGNTGSVWPSSNSTSK